MTSCGGKAPALPARCSSLFLRLLEGHLCGPPILRTGTAAPSQHNPRGGRPAQQRSWCGTPMLESACCCCVSFPNSVSLEGSNGGKKESLRMTPQRGPAAALAAAPAAAFAARVYRDSRSFAHPEGSKLKEATCQITICLRPRLRPRLLSLVIRLRLLTQRAPYRIHIRSI